LNDTTIDKSDQLEQIIAKYREEGGTVIGLLQDVSGVYRYLPEEVLEQLSDELEIPLAKLYTLSTFYKSFRLEPLGDHHVCVCVGTACHVNGAQKLVDTLERDFHIEAGETTDDGKYTLETVNCLGACAMGPLVVIDGEYHGKMDQKKMQKVLKKYETKE
jgi:NADH-quinone oxidoreductase subunit E